MSILCQTIPCTSPALLVCQRCERGLCGSHYGTGSSSLCKRCFEEPITAPASTAANRGDSASLSTAVLGGAGVEWGSEAPALQTNPSEGAVFDHDALDTPA